jgi:epoxyqueuosine reductase
LLEDAQSVVSAALCYYAPEPSRPPGHGRLPRYTWHDGYAELREKLDVLGRALGAPYRVLVDANQHVDREAAARSGVGFYGKNTMLITPRHGSWVVLGTLVTAAALEPTPPLATDCGSCTLCIDACPTGALDDPGTLDATKCLSYWTQTPESIPAAYRESLGVQVYGCDICQDVCPWNRKAPAGFWPQLQSRPDLVNPALDWLASLDKDGFKRVFRRSPVERTKLKGLRRNVAIAMGNSREAKYAPSLESWLNDEDEAVRESAAWAIARIATNE